MSSTFGPRCLRISSVLTLLALLFLILVLESEGMSLEKICESRCFYGKGGQLCNCNAAHFAGKRTAGQQVVAKRDFTSSSREDGERPEDAATDSKTSGDISRPRHNGDGNTDLDASDDGSLVLGSFVDDDRHQRSTAVQKLASLLKDAIDER